MPAAPRGMPIAASTAERTEIVFREDKLTSAVRKADRRSFYSNDGQNPVGKTIIGLR